MYFQTASTDSSLPLYFPKPFLDTYIAFNFIDLCFGDRVRPMIPLVHKISVAIRENHHFFCLHELSLGWSHLSAGWKPMENGDRQAQKSRPVNLTVISVSGWPWKGVQEYYLPTHLEKYLKQCLLMANNEN